MASQLFMIFGLGTTELILILLVVLLLFGAKKIPDLARGLGSGIREFKDASREIKREIDAPDQRSAATNQASTAAPTSDKN